MRIVEVPRVLVAKNLEPLAQSPVLQSDEPVDTFVQASSVRSSGVLAVQEHLPSSQELLALLSIVGRDDNSHRRFHLVTGEA